MASRTHTTYLDSLLVLLVLLLLLLLLRLHFLPPTPTARRCPHCNTPTPLLPQPPQTRAREQPLMRAPPQHQTRRQGQRLPRTPRDVDERGEGPHGGGDAVHGQGGGEEGGAQKDKRDDGFVEAGLGVEARALREDKEPPEEGDPQEGHQGAEEPAVCWLWGLVGSVWVFIS